MAQTADTTSQHKKSLPPPIRSAIGRLRSKIRRYVVLEGIALAAISLCVTFWLFYALDYLPVYLFGRNELPWLARAILLVMIGLLAFWVLYRWVFRRLFVDLKDRSIALLLERKFSEFKESLITTVEAAKNDSTHSVSGMLTRTQNSAESVLGEIDVGQVINTSPLYQKLSIAGVLCLTVLALAIIRPNHFQIASQRLYFLDDQKWPRQCHIEIVGFKVKRENLIDGIDELNQIVELQHGEFKVAKGSSLTLLVRAETATKKEPENSSRTLPNSCVINYRSSEGNRGQQSLKRIGAPRDGYQLYSLDGQPLQGVLADLSFSIRGGDHRVGPFSVRVVDSPTVVETNLACEFPDYMVDPVSMRWTPRTIRWSGYSQLPQGTKITIQAKTNKKLKTVYAYDLINHQMQTVVPGEEKFEFEIESLDQPTNFQFFMCDTDGIVSEQPHQISIQPIEDQPPIVETSLDGIGTAVTPEVRIPIRGKIEDDYDVERQWVSIETPVSGPIITEFQTEKGIIDTAIDFKDRRQESRDNISLPTGDGSQLVLMVQAEDRFNLRASANIGLGDRYVLDIVSAGELLRILERLEVGQRRRLEQIYAEVIDARDYLVRSKSTRSDFRSITEPGDENWAAESDDPDSDRVRSHELRMLFSQRSIIQTDKSIQEILGVAIEFDNIRKQLINNRVDSEDRKQRLSEKIVAPLQLIANESMQQLKTEIQSLEMLLKKLQENAADRTVSTAADEQAVTSIERIDVVLTELDQVLSILVKYETQNELLDIVRQMIRQQQEIAERTQKERKRKAFEGLLD